MTKAITYIGNKNKKVFKVLQINQHEYGWCIVPRDSQKQLFRSYPNVILTLINVKKEKYLLKMGFCRRF